MKKVKRITALLLSTIFVIGMNTVAFASENINVDQEQQTGMKIAYSEMPKEYKSVISPDAIIYQQEDGSYDIYQNESILKPEKSPRPMAMYPRGGNATWHEADYYVMP